MAGLASESVAGCVRSPSLSRCGPAEPDHPEAARLRYHVEPVAVGPADQPPLYGDAAHRAARGMVRERPQHLHRVRAAFKFPSVGSPLGHRRTGLPAFVYSFPGIGVVGPHQ